MTDDPQLVLTRGPQTGHTFPLHGDSLVLGRDPRNDIVISHPQVSRRHARITREGDTWVIEDLDSTNGTFVNGRPVIAPRALTRGDTVELSEAVALMYRQATAVPEERPQRGDRPLAPPPWPPRDQEDPRRTVPPGPGSAVQAVARPETLLQRERTWIWVGIGCFVLLLVVACAAVFLLDALRLLPAIFYEPFRWLGLI
ncbi:MAG: FHA domain-containing protein [Chloroflexota bacterium]|nr:FHA domain-containing protein [Chloroflexota bacterium]